MWEDIKKRWVSELRSGNWEQGHNYLKSFSETSECAYCCLGVLAEMQDNLEDYSDLDNTMLTTDAIRTMGMPSDSDSIMNMIDYIVDNYSGKLGVVDKEHLISCADSYANHDLAVQAVLATLNDSAGLNFDQIADIVEASL